MEAKASYFHGRKLSSSRIFAIKLEKVFGVNTTIENPIIVVGAEEVVSSSVSMDLLSFNNMWDIKLEIL